MSILKSRIPLAFPTDLETTFILINALIASPRLTDSLLVSFKMHIARNIILSSLGLFAVLIAAVPMNINPGELESAEWGLKRLLSVEKVIHVFQAFP
jgi:hypothetical protein